MRPRLPTSASLLIVALLSALPASGADRAVPSAAPGAKDRLARWSLSPLVKPPPPALPTADSAWARNPIDRFILARLRDKGLKPAPEADRRTLIRRLSFDLLGLPPSPEEEDAFVADPDPLAYEKLVDRLLASPHYGERWARHWLDVVHYGETHGYDKDKPRPNAWPYRDYVIRSFNADKPYGRFVQEQVAGDVLFPGSADGVEALGFIAAGPWDFIGHAEVPETKIDGKIARHLDRDDMVATTMNTFVSLTVQCAQCHNHKFDPITQEDYYSLQAVFAALDRADKPYDPDPAIARRRSALTARLRALDLRGKPLQERLARAGGRELAEIERRIQEASRPAGAPRPEFGYHSGIEKVPDRVKWVQVDLGRAVAIDRVVYCGCHDDFNHIGAGFGFPARFKVEAADDPDFKTGVRLIEDHTQADFPNPGTAPRTVAAGVVARFVRVTATKLAARQDDYNFALAELSVLDAAGHNLALGAEVTALDSIEAPPRWSKRNLVDGIAPGLAGPGAADLAMLTARRKELLDRLADAGVRQELEEVTRQRAEVQQELGKLPSPRLVYAGTVHTGSGAFTGTGASGGQPRDIHILNRGDVRKPGKEVGPGALGALQPALPARFDLPQGHPEGDRRAALARWLTDPRNPLTWRSIVNRVWLYHFGRGLVDSPNDFGRMGQLPTHPELLDWLAADFRDGGQSLKALHRLIVTSATYRQSSAIDPRAAAVDAGNAWLSHVNRRRLEAEEVRDSILWAGGVLNPQMYGPSFQDFVIDKPEHSPHYEYRLHDPEDPRCHRRSIYRFIVRSQQQPFMAALDCADPSMAVDRRNQSVSPLQALALLNDRLALVMAKHFAQRVARSGGDLDSQVTLAFRLALGRPPTPDERGALADYARKHGLASTCRVLFNLSEFVFVD